MVAYSTKQQSSEDRTAGTGWLLVVAAILGITFAFNASAQRLKFDEERPFRIDLGVGQCKFKERDSAFWQSYHPHSMGLTSKCGEVGIWAPLNDKLGWFVRYVPMGFQQVNALAQTLPNDDYAQASHSTAVLTRPSCNVAFDGNNCLYQWNSAGNMNGFAVGMTVNAYKSGDFRIDPEFGMLFYTLKWRAQVHPLGCFDNCPWRVEVNQYASRQKTPMVGLTVRNGDFYIGWRLYLHSSDHTPVTAPHSGPVHQLIAGVSF